MALEFDADEEELALFLAENSEHLQRLDQRIVQLEQSGNDPDLLQEIFRSAHTIKGGAGMIGHQRMAELAHAVENVLDALRAGSIPVTKSLIDALLAALDALRILNDEVVTRVQTTLPLEEIKEDLASCLVPLNAPGERRVLAGAASAHAGESRSLIDDGMVGPRYMVSVRIDPESRFRAARTLQVYLELKRSTYVVHVTPGLAEIEADESTSTLEALVVTTEVPSLLELRLARISDVAEASVEPVGEACGVLNQGAATGGESETGPEAEMYHQPAPLAAAGYADSPDRSAPASGSRARDHSLQSGLFVKPQGAIPPTSSYPLAGAKPPAPDRPSHPEGSVRVAVGIIDDLMNLVSELVLGRTRLRTLGAALHHRYPNDGDVAALEDVADRLDSVTTDLQAAVLKARMVPVETVFNKFPRLVRDLAAQVGKQVNFTMSDHRTELDRSVIEQLSDPLMHLLRNCIDHGIEPPEERLAAGKPALGEIALSATSLDNQIVIEVRDDGRGIDRAKVTEAAVRKGLFTPESAERLTDQEAVELVFASGLSTARAVTDLSGRGVGMDIVKVAIERMGGKISVAGKPGKGTTFVVTLPLTLAIMQALLVSVGDAVYALPMNMVTEILSVSEDQVHMLQGTEATLLRGTILPLVRLRDWFGCSSAALRTGRRHIVAVRVDGRSFGLVVDHFLGEQEIVMKPLGAYMGLIPGLAGATILGDGRIALLVDVAALHSGAPRSPHDILIPSGGAG
jgi:two-component system chemotaxis sensor kinase CheA